MIQEHLAIEGIPATLWGEESDTVVIAVHGQSSHKEDLVISILADEAARRRYQVLSFDLPDHGERKTEKTPCTVRQCSHDLGVIGRYVTGRWRDIRLFACSMGAYFSLRAYPDLPLSVALFLSPVVDMERIIRNMMNWFEITPEMLEREGEIRTPAGQTLVWDAYRYVIDHPVRRWGTETFILYGGRDEICEPDTIHRFTGMFHGTLTIMEEGEHFFHTDEQLQTVRDWVSASIGHSPGSG